VNRQRVIGNGELRLAAQLARLGRQSVRYGLVSTLALACDVAVYAVALRLAAAPPAAGAIGYATGLLVHYVLSSSWVFPDQTGERRILPTFARFAASGLMGLLITTTIIGVLTMSGVSGAFGAKAAAVGLTYVAVFVVRRRYVFARPRPDGRAPSTTRVPEP
jgi:putative flippase GtrA